ncbi:hypothetical protein MesoLjLc_71430 [Mesorhizobium sp. L-8-10]|uniref:cytochrome c3 family protein n=1 Tax=Mesorhizobium sp. L-8-10 TaxID=2744523 RepID=UPI001926849B|nr:cytochrome c3 family protein [Mesorhizobium sp. L-8-10]BCH35213.1 hypothetical protein MesoLjLc_71430 [Mesorhizobium sp. L-8-10]
MQRFVRYGSRAGLASVAAAVLLLVMQPTDAAWWLVRIPGVAALLLAAAAVAIPPAPRRPTWHAPLGRLAIAALFAHILSVVAQEPEIWRWLSAAMPVEIALGLGAAIALSMTLAVRRSRSLRLRVGPPATLGLHRIAGLVACAAAGAHVALVAGSTFTIVSLVACGVAMLLVAGNPAERHLPALIVTLGLGTGAAAALAAGPLAQTRLAGLRASPVDHAGFSHGDHGSIACTTCHHNFVDGSGKENCITCHKRLTISEPMRVDRMFHAFCGECHREEKAAGRKTGPIDHCMG